MWYYTPDVLSALLVMLFGVGLLADGEGASVIAVVVFCRGFGFEFLKSSVLVGRVVVVVLVAARVRLTGLTGFTSLSPGSSDCVICVGFGVAVPVPHNSGVPEGRNSTVVGACAVGRGGLGMFTLFFSTKAVCG